MKKPRLWHAVTFGTVLTVWMPTPLLAAEGQILTSWRVLVSAEVCVP